MMEHSYGIIRNGKAALVKVAMMMVMMTVVPIVVYHYTARKRKCSNKKRYYNINKFFFLWTCGCVFSKTAMDELGIKNKSKILVYKNILDEILVEISIQFFSFWIREKSSLLRWAGISCKCCCLKYSESLILPNKKY